MLPPFCLFYHIPPYKALAQNGRKPFFTICKERDLYIALFLFNQLLQLCFFCFLYWPLYNLYLFYQYAQYNCLKGIQTVVTAVVKKKKFHPLMHFIFPNLLFYQTKKDLFSMFSMCVSNSTSTSIYLWFNNPSSIYSIISFLANNLGFSGLHIWEMHEYCSIFGYLNHHKSIHPKFSTNLDSFPRSGLLTLILCSFPNSSDIKFF